MLLEKSIFRWLQTIAFVGTDLYQVFIIQEV